MSRHKQFITHQTSEVKHLIKYNSKNLASSTTLFVASHHVVKDSYEYRNSLEVLETLRTVLCLCYQHKFIPDPSKKDAVCIQQTMIAFDKLDVDEIQSSLDAQLKIKDFPHWTELSVVLDILVLHMTLYYKVSDILECLEKLQNLINQHLEEHNELTIFHTKVMDCYVDSLLLHKEIASVFDELEGEKVKTLFLQNVQLWLKLGVQKNTDLLVVILPKLIKVVSAGEILTKVWEMILTLNNSTKTVSMLHLTADIWFPIESEHIKELIDQSLDERLWLLLLKELSSLLPRQSKPALELAKRVVNFVDNHRTEDFKFFQYQELSPLVCFGDDTQRGIFKENLNNWFLVLEELETDEDEEHVVTPAFELLKDTFKETPDIHGFHIAWIRCIYSRILQDWNLDMMKWGLHEVLTLDLALYNDEFLDVVVDVLCDTYYYGNYENQEDPLIVKKLVNLLNSAERTNSDLVTRFMVKASTKRCWCPAALFYTIHALSMVNRVQSVWKEFELEAVKSLVETISSTVKCPLLRIGSQIKILEAMTHFATESLDLLTVANTLSAFPTSEALTRGQLAWKLTSTWLSKLVKKEEAMSFLENICGQIARENSPTDISMKSLSLIIMLFHDAHFLLNSESCRGFTALRNLLNCLIDENSGPYDDWELENRSIELVHHLLNLASLKDNILYEFISNYVDAILRFTFRILRHVSDEALIENIDTYVRVTQKFFAADSLFATKPETLKHIERFESESCYIIDDKQWSNNLRRFFGIKILHACLKSTSAKLKNYKFIGPLCKAYRIPMTQPPYEGAASNSQNTDGNLEDKIASEYYKIVAQVFCDYLEDEPVDNWLPDINWIGEVSYLIQVGGKDIYAPLVGILSQIFFKGVLRSMDIAVFKSVVRLCWKCTLGVKECGSTTEEMINLIFSSPFLECEETRELTIECAGEMVGRGEKIPELRVILLNGLKRLKEENLCHFYNPLLTCLLHGGGFDREKKIEHQASFYVLERYRAVYPNYLSNIRNANTDVIVRVHAVTLMHKMITDDPMHAAKLFPLILDELNETQNKKDLDDDDDCMAYHREHRILQSLLVLQPILETDAIDPLHRLLCNNIFSETSELGVRLMQELLLIRIYLDNEYWRARVWDLFEKRGAKEADGICSVLNIVYHVALLLSTDLQMDFLNAAFQHIMPCSMSQQLLVRLHTQALTSKMYDLASAKSYSTVAEKYRELHTALTRSFKHGTVSISLEDDFDFTVFHPIDDYSLETLFYELPRFYNASTDDYIPPQMLEKFGFKESNSHPLKLLNLANWGELVLPQGDERIGLQACSHILDCYQEVFPNLSTMNSNNDAATRAYAVTLLHMIITDDPTHAAQLLPLLYTKLTESQANQDLEDSHSQAHHLIQNRIMQVLLVLQPVLETDDVESLHTLLCDNLLSSSSQPGVRIMQQWLLMRIYLQNENLRAEIWNLFEQGERGHVDGLCSVVSVVYHVARFLSPDWQPDFINTAFNHIMPFCMSDESNIRFHAQVVASKLFDLASEKTYTTITEKYREFYISLRKKLERGHLMRNSAELRDHFQFTDFNPVDDYSLENLFYKVPKLSEVSSDEYILPQVFNKFGFRESNAHPLNLLNRTEHPIKIEPAFSLTSSSGSDTSVAVDNGSSEDCTNHMQVPYVTTSRIKDELETIDETMTIVKEEWAGTN